MNREQLVQIISDKIKLIRTEYNYTQEQMAEFIGISKKTLVQIEKQRNTCGWTVAVTMCTLFRNSTILQTTLGGNPLMFVQLVAGEGTVIVANNEVNDKIWWRTVENNNQWRMQQNLVHTSYRIINPNNHMVLYTLSKEEAVSHFKAFIEQSK